MASLARQERLKLIERAGYETDWEGLSVEGRWTAANIADLLSHGYSQIEVARFYGQSQVWVKIRLAALRREIEEQFSRELSPNA